MTDIEQLWQTFREPLGAFLRKRVPQDDAEDLLGDVFLKLYEHTEELQQVQDPRAWLYRITRNAVVDRYRRGRHEHPVDELYDLPADLDEDHATELAQCVERLMLSLPEADQRALHLVAEGVSQEELAQREGLSPTGARSRVQRARKKLGEAFRACCRLEFDGVGRVIDWRRHGDPSPGDPSPGDPSRGDQRPDC